MGNASGKGDGEGTSSSGVKYGGEEGYEQEEGMEFAAHGGVAPISYHHSQGVYAEAEPMVHSPPHNPVGYLHPPPLFSPQVFSLSFYLLRFDFLVAKFFVFFYVIEELNKYFSD